MLPMRPLKNIAQKICRANCIAILKSLWKEGQLQKTIPWRIF
jgi:hypothetical protein